MRVLIFHGYLLRGTGSNVYNANLAAAFVREGHDVSLLCQERDPDGLDFVARAGTWEGGSLELRELRSTPGITLYRPDIGGILPVYVADSYAGLEARTFSQLSPEEVEDYVERNVAAVREVVARDRPDVALANHLVMGPAILARALRDSGVPYAVKVHGSALEYTVKPEPKRFLPYAREGLAAASAVLVGSRHTAESLWSAMGDPGLAARTRLGPPGVDVARFAPRSEDDARAGLKRLARQEAERAAHPDAEAGEATSFTVDHAAAAQALARLDPAHERLVTFVGKLIVSKGVDLLAAAWPLVLAQAPDATLVVVGFGAYRDGLERLIAALADGDVDAALAIARQGRGLEGGPAAPLRHLGAFLDDVAAGSHGSYLEAARGLRDRVVLTGRLEHDQLEDLLPACWAQIVPSTFPEAFGMVAAEAAACGLLPISADHSGLAEVTAALAREVPAPASEWLAFTVSDRAPEEIAGHVLSWLQAPPELRERTRAALVHVAREHYSWEGVARGVIAAAEGNLDVLDPVPGRGEHSRGHVG